MHHSAFNSGKIPVGINRSFTWLKTVQYLSRSSEFLAIALYGPKILTGEVGGSITIKCVYRPIKANRYDRKYWCKISGTRRVCNTIISTNNFISKDYKGRASLTDFPKNGTFTIQMTQLEQNDAGAYRYGIGNNNKALFVSTDPNLSSEYATPDLKYSGATFTESFGTVDRDLLAALYLHSRSQKPTCVCWKFRAVSVKGSVRLTQYILNL
uniref:Immunoglobulin V-set domain-containing protein n=1 Tax=Terrapene triunguis TaxID=2587831 RepID=A0A674IMQ6_9SAUR